MKKIFFLCLLAVTILHAGREFIEPALAREKLRDLLRQILIIRVQMNFEVAFADFEDISMGKRLANIQKFDDIWIEFKKSKEYFDKNCITSADKAQFVFCTVQILLDRKRYNKELVKLHRTLNTAGKS